MRPLSASQLLDIWDRGQALSTPRQALLLLGAACPEPPAALAALTVGERDARLLTLREWSFGPRLQSVAPCPACSEQLELDFAIADIRVPTGDPAPRELKAGDWQLRYRLPNAGDLVALAEGGGPATGRTLLQRCLLEARHCAQEAPPSDLSPEVARRVSEAMADADPQADVRLNLSCPACAHPWLAPFDIGAFFWAEIEAWAIRTLREVHALARAYGWSEAEILALSPLRRQCYLELARL